MFEPVSIGFCTGFVIAAGCSTAAHRKQKKTKDIEKTVYPKVKYDIIEPNFTKLQ